MNTSKKIIICSIILVLLQSNAFAKDDDFLPRNGAGNSRSYQVVRHSNYILAYDEDGEQPAWVAYELVSSELGGGIKRTDNFRLDPEVITSSANLQDYKGSGFDRGHLAPAADFSFSRSAMSESFYLSNMSPQDPSLNRGLWARLEKQVRNWAGKYKRVYIVTSAVLPVSQKKRKALRRIGASSVIVPEQYYKIVYDPQRQSMIAFLLPNRKPKQSLENYISTVDNVEAVTGLDFFPELPDDLENRLEKTTNKSLWSFSIKSNFTKAKQKTSTAPKSSTNNGLIKMSKSGICHSPSSSYYSRTKNFTPYQTIEACLNAGSRLPKR